MQKPWNLPLIFNRKAIHKNATRWSENCVSCLVCPLSVFPDTSSHLHCTGSSRGSGSSVLASVHAKAEGVQFTGFPNPIELCTTRNGEGLAQITVDLLLGEIQCGCTRRLHSSPSGLSSLKLRFFNVLLLSSIPNTTIVAAKVWTKGRARLTYFPVQPLLLLLPEVD